jgi:hypothetical protein
MGDLERERRELAIVENGKNKNRLGSNENKCQSLARTLIAPMVTPNTDDAELAKKGRLYERK